MPVLESTITIRLTLNTTTGILEHKVQGSHPWQSSIGDRRPGVKEQWFSNLGASVISYLETHLRAAHWKVEAVQPEVLEKVLRETETGHPVADEARMLLEGLHEFYGDAAVRLPRPARDHGVSQSIGVLDSKLIEGVFNSALDQYGFQLVDSPLVAKAMHNNLKVLFGTSILRLGERSPDDE